MSIPKIKLNSAINGVPNPPLRIYKILCNFVRGFRKNNIGTCDTGRHTFLTRFSTDKLKIILTP